MENKKWILLCLIGGILMIIGSVVGDVTFFAMVFSILEDANPDLAPILNLVLRIFNYIALGGGASVIIGSIIVAIGQYGIGKFIISLGAGMGLIGLIVYLITGIYAGTLSSELLTWMLSLVSLNGGFGFLGVILTIIGRFKLKKPE
ncbi:MAG: conserved membrane protein of unknown function [Promethearchaeota archaeon]|nr:MAG: conserved membrane protein of unknown function [Candidatus Lokiarchaeota archaeon]